jgi:hypothetical protein
MAAGDKCAATRITRETKTALQFHAHTSSTPDNIPNSSKVQVDNLLSAVLAPARQSYSDLDIDWQSISNNG